MQNPKLLGKVALVTGGARGLGRAYVLHLAQLGADVVVNDINLRASEEYGENLQAESVAAEVEMLGRRGMGIEAAVANKRAVSEMVNQVVTEFGGIDILVTNAGGNLTTDPDQTATGTAENTYRHLMDINLTGTIHCCQEVSRVMKANRKSGKIVTVASQAGMWSGRDGGGMAYKVSKAGVIQYTKVLAAELGPHRICVNCIAPGFVLSSRALAQGRNEPPARDALIEQIPLGRLGLPEDCAKVVEFLVTDLSDYVTGQCIPVCGGFVAF